MNIQTMDPANAGDWGRVVTAAMYNYDESIKDYPLGCVLVLHEVRDKRLLIWGEDYVIETSEYRITKRIQRGSSDESIMAYSTNRATHLDGKLIHEPLEIYLSSVKRLYRVMGFISGHSEQLMRLTGQ